MPALIASLALQAGAVATYAVTRPPYRPFLVVEIAGLGDGKVLITQSGVSAPLMLCEQSHCRVQLDRGAEIKLVAMPGEGATFEGWRQMPGRTPVVLRPWLGDPLASCLTEDLTSEELVARTLAGDPLQCAVAVERDVKVEVSFGAEPEEAELAIADVQAIPGVELPPLPEPPEAIDAEKLEENAVEVALVPPPPPEPLAVPPPEQPQEKKEKREQPPPPPPNMRMVEVPDENEVEKAPDDAEHLSDKNRDVAEEEVATETNLEKESKGEATASIESPDTTSPEIGGPEDQIHQLEESEATAKRAEESDHSGESDHAEGAITGEGGDNGDDGSGKDPGILAMRGIQGRGAIRDRSKPGDAGKRGRPGIDSPLKFEDYERIVGKDKADKERQTAERRMSAKRGRWEKKMAAIKSALENFTPDIRHGNQTALKTRAAPFAVYVARMHRSIHEDWGFGFLEDLDGKSADHPLNDFDLFTNIELAINPDGTIHKLTIAKTSGNLMFDVAALDTIQKGEPYQETPEKIRSVDGRVYMRWGFYRNWRQCGTFNVEFYILDEIPGGAEPLDDGAMVRNVPGVSKKTVTPPPSREEPAKPTPASSVKDDKALYAANLWVSGFATADVDKLVRFSATPFHAAGTIAAKTEGDLRDMYQGLIVESGPLKDWALLTGDEYGKRIGKTVELPEGGLLLVVRTAKESFTVILMPTRSGEYRATQLVR